MSSIEESSAGADPQVAVITGASAGIGLATTERLLTSGWRVYALSRRRPLLGDGVPIAGLTHVAVDLADHAAVDATALQLVEAARSLDALVHCAGINIRGSVTDVALADFDYQFSVNLRAPFALTSALLPALRTAGGGVVFVNSSQGLVAGADATPYAATKHGLKALADGLRAEESATGVRVCTIYPGRTNTEGQQGIFAHEGRTYTPQVLIQPATIADIIHGVLTLPREAEMTDVTIRTARRA